MSYLSNYLNIVDNGDCNNRHCQLMIYFKRIQFYMNSLRIDLNYKPLHEIQFERPIDNQANGKLKKIYISYGYRIFIYCLPS